MAFTWTQVRDVVDAALDLPHAERGEYLDRACPQPELRKYVDSLILSYDRAGSFLETPVSVVDNARSGEEEGLWVGRRLGPYEIVQEIGRGGMGAVYRAVRADDQYQKQVAIKLVRGIHTTFTLSRFRAERQILATLEHPNIARLLDGGTTDEGIPYFVMELVEGVPIDQYCDEQRLAVRERLQLFRSVCSAVEYAHQKLIVHRDLKPGNILINKEGVPKLLDFGIAKILSPDSVSSEPELTVPFLRVMTPEYASPEQLAGEPITTVSDVYSLGVILYILLTGRRPYELDTRRPDEMATAVRDTEPLRPSVVALRAADTRQIGQTTQGITPESVALARGVKPQKLRRQLAGDLDNIVQMALRKQPERRYVSVEQFSEDIRRHLEGLPIRARRETFGYRAQKFISRNRIAVTAGVFIAVTLVAGSLATLHEARIARAQEAKADRRFQDVRQLANSLLFELHDGIANLPGATPVRKRMVGEALKYLDSLSKEAKGDRSLELELASAYDKIGDVQGLPHEANLGDQAGALASYEKALSIRESLVKENPADAKVLRELIGGYIRLSDLQWSLGEQLLALETVRKEIPTADKLFALEPNSPENKEVIARSHVDQGYKEAMLGDQSGGLKILEQGINMFEEIASEHPNDAGPRRSLAITYGRIAEIQRMHSTGYADSLASFRKAIEALKPAIAADPNNAEVRRISAYYEHAIGELLGDLGQTNAAISQENVALASFHAMARADPANVQLQVDVARVRGHIGSLLVKSGEPRRAVSELQESIAALSRMQDAKNPRSYAGYALITDQLWAGKAYVALAARSSAANNTAACRQAESWFRLCLPQFESLRNAEPYYEGAERSDEIRRELSHCTASQK